MAKRKVGGLSDKVKERMAKLKGSLNQGGGGGKKLFLKTKGVDNFVLRLLPVDLEKDDPFLEVGNHWIGGQNDGRGFNCPEVIANKPCPICQMAVQLAEDAETEAEEKLAKALKVRRRAYFKVIDREDEEAGVRVWQAPTTAAEQILDIMTKRGDITDAQEGRDLDIGKSEGKNGFTEYKVVQDDRSALSDDPEELKKWVKESNKIDMRKLVPLDVKAMMEAAEKQWPNLDFEFDADEYGDENDSEEDEEDDEEPDNFKKKSPAKSSKRTTRKSEPEEDDESEEDSDDEEDDSEDADESDDMPFGDGDLRVGDSCWYESSTGKKVTGKIVKDEGDTFKVEKDADGRKISVAKDECHVVSPLNNDDEDEPEDQDEEADETEEEEEAPITPKKRGSVKSKNSDWETKYDFPEKQFTVEDLKKKKADIPECFGECGIQESDEACLECPISKDCFRKTFPDQVGGDGDESDEVMNTLKGRKRK